MRSISKIITVLIAVTLSQTAMATVLVDSLNYPVWIERDEQSKPLSPGDRLREGDVVQTGIFGRVWLQVDDGSVVKLGQTTRFVVTQVKFLTEEEETFLQASFNVLKGAFRFTSRFFEPKRNTGHRVNFKIGTITAGIRGTDIWGRSADDEDFVALIEGGIEVSSSGSTPVVIDQPLSLYRKAKSQSADAPQPVTLETIQKLAAETELDKDAGIASITGEYQLILMSLRTPELIDANINRFVKAGYSVNTGVLDIDGETYTRVFMSGLVDRVAAGKLGYRIEQEFGIENTWVLKNEI